MRLPGRVTPLDGHLRRFDVAVDVLLRIVAFVLGNGCDEV